MATILIVEDELLIAGDIARAMARLGHTPLESVDNSEDALEALASQAVELVLMDVNIVGEMDGVATALQIHRQYRIPVVFLTARTDQATINRAKVAQPFGFITKPFTDDSLRIAVDLALHRAYDAVAARSEPQLAASSAPAADTTYSFRNTQGEDFVFVRHQGRWVKVLFQDIRLLESDANYVKLYTATERFHFDSSLKELESRLPPCFVKIHRSFIVNLSHVKAYEEGYVELSSVFDRDDNFINVGRTYQKDLKTRLHLIG